MRSVAAGPGRSPWNTCLRPSPSISVKRPVLMVFSRIRANSILFDPRHIGASLNRLLAAGQVAAAAGLPGIFATRDSGRFHGRRFTLSGALKREREGGPIAQAM